MTQDLGIEHYIHEENGKHHTRRSSASGALALSWRRTQDHAAEMQGNPCLALAELHLGCSGRYLAFRGWLIPAQLFTVEVLRDIVQAKEGLF